MDEISTRRRKLSTRSRTLLIAIDGHHSVTQLQTMFASFGDIGLLLDELADQGLVELGGGPVRQPTPLPQSRAPVPPVAAPLPTPAAITPTNAAGESGAMEARRMMNEAAVSSLGFRAFGFTLKLEHCYSANEVRSLLPMFVQLMTKSKGTAVAAELQQRIETLLGQ